MTTNDTAAALAKLLDDVACRRCDHDDPIGDVGREEIDRAITAHVAAEVARALACADSVDEAIEAFDETSAAYGAAKRGFDLAARERAAAAQVASIDRLRAAIAADKARAVEAASSCRRTTPTAWPRCSRSAPGRPRRCGRCSSAGRWRGGSAPGRCAGSTPAH